MAVSSNIDKFSNIVSNEDVFQEQRDEILILQSSLSEEDAEQLIIFTEDMQNIFQMSISPKLESQVTMDIIVPAEDQNDDEVELPAGAQSPVIASPHLSRSESGRKHQYKLPLRHLLPLTLNITLPPGYPLEEPPHFTISCHWLSASALGLVCRKLDQLYKEFSGFPILYTWAEWIKTELLSFLEVKDTIVFTPTSLQSLNEDGRAQPFVCPLDQVINLLLDFDRKETVRIFRNTMNTCGVCYDEFHGSHMFMLPQCHHHFCHECVKDFCTMHIKDGTVFQLKCPAIDCDSDLMPDLIKACVNKEEFDRWQDLVLIKGLDRMGDIKECSRCCAKVIIDTDGSRLGCCPVCYFSFCTDCGDSWHQSSPCFSDLKKEMGDAAPSGDEEEELKKQNYNERYNRFIEHLNLLRIKAESKPCPICGSGIYKDYGCNNVHCASCGGAMCWVCGKAISGYDHFEGGKSCHLLNTPETILPDKIIKLEEKQKAYFDVKDQEAEEQRKQRQKQTVWRKLTSQELARSAKCPRCKQLHIKAGTNNHTKCWRCKTDFCFQCKVQLFTPITAHYRVPNTCSQHS